jgi:hypothetical protein
MIDLSSEDLRTLQLGPVWVLRVLDRIGPPTGPDFRMALVRIAVSLGRLRGPYGRQPTTQDEQMILLIAALLDVEPIPGPPSRLAFEPA